MATQYANGKIVTSGLVLALDAADRNSYVSGSTVWNDVSENGNTGILTNGPIFSNNSIVFDGTNDYVDCGGYSSGSDASSFSICFVSSFQAGSTSYPINRGNDYFGNGWSIQCGGGIFAVVVNGVSYNSGVVATNVDSTIPNYYACIYSRSSGILSAYCNNNFISSGSCPTNGSLRSSTRGWILGTVNPNGYWFKGGIHNVQIYNRTLSTQEVLQNYNAQKSRFNL